MTRTYVAWILLMLLPIACSKTPNQNAPNPGDTVDKSAEALLNRGRAHEHDEEYEKAIKDYTEALRVDANFAKAHNALAWILATCPKDGVRNGRKAVEHATKACELSSWKNADNLDSLAAAHAESGNFKEAVKWQKKAMELGISDKDEVEKAKQRLKLYEAGKPYRDE